MQQGEVFFYTYETVDLPIVFQNKSVLNNYQKIMISLRHTATMEQLDLDAAQYCDINTSTGTITLHLSQEHTGMFHKGTVELQVNIVYQNGERDVSKKVKIEVYDNLHKKVIE